MSRTSIGILIGLLVAILAASRFEGSMATGVLAGYLFGASIGLCGFAWQRHVIRLHPERAMGAQMMAFLMKLGGLALSVACLRFLEPLARFAHWKPFVVAYVAAALVALVLGSLDNARTLRGPASRRSTSGHLAPASGNAAPASGHVAPVSAELGSKGESAL